MKRIITGTIFAVLLIGTILLRNVSLAFFDVFMGLLIVTASYEMCSALEKLGKKTSKYVAMGYPIVMYLMYILAIRFEMELWQLILSQLCVIDGAIIIAFFVELFALLIKRKKDKKLRTKQKSLENSDNFALISLKISLNTVIAVVYPCLFMGLIFVLSHIKDFYFVKAINGVPDFDLGMLALALLFLVTCITDIFAMVVGSVFKGPRLCPLISPKKTISGAVGGLVFAVVGSIIAFFCFNLVDSFHSGFSAMNITVLTFIVFAVVGSIFSQIGDIFASIIKRRAGIKDYGSILPGHGGVLDRFDGVIFNTIVVLCLTCIFFL